MDNTVNTRMTKLLQHRLIYILIACALALLAGSALIVAFLPRSATGESADTRADRTLTRDRLTFTHPLIDQSPRGVSTTIMPPRPTQTLKISGLTALLNGQTLDQVRVSVRNYANAPLTGYVWFILSSTREQPWTSAVYTAPEARIQRLLPGASADFFFAVPRALIGDYYLSAWVHDDGTGERRHADGISLPEPLALTQPFTFVSDAALPPPQTITQTIPLTREFDTQAFVISAISTEQTPRSLERVRVTVVNIAEAPRTGYVWFTLAPPDSDQPWRTAIYTAPEQQISDLAVGARFEAVFDLPDQLAQGEWRLTAWTHALDDTGARFHSDGDPFTRPIVIGHPLDFALHNTQLQPNNTLETTFALRNNTDRATAISLFYTLSDPDDLTPWREPAFATAPAAITLLPGEQYIWTAAQPLALPAGAYHLIGWLHERQGDTYRLMAAQMHPQPLVILPP